MVKEPSSVSKKISIILLIIVLTVITAAIIKMVSGRRSVVLREQIYNPEKIKQISEEVKPEPQNKKEITEKKKAEKPARVPSIKASYSNSDLKTYSKPLPEKDRDEISKNTGSDKTLHIRKELEKAIKYVNKNNYRKALQIVEKLDLQEPVSRLYIGIVQFSRRKFTKAENNITYGLKHPLNKEDQFYGEKFLALTYYEMNKLEKSMSFARKALARKKDKLLNILINKIKRENRAMKNYGDSESEHFNIVFSKEEHDEIRLWIRDILEDAYDEVGKRLGLHPRTGLTVILYNQRNFFDVTRAPGWAGGVYDGKIRLPIKGLTKATPNLKRIIIHEYTHALIHKITLKCPLWLNEGLAEYFSLGDVQEMPQYIPLFKLEKRFPGYPPRAVSIAYRVSYSAVRRLERRYGMYRIKDLLNKLSEGVAFPEAFEDVFYISYKKFILDWHDDSQQEK